MGETDVPVAILAGRVCGLAQVTLEGSSHEVVLVIIEVVVVFNGVIVVDPLIITIAKGRSAPQDSRITLKEDITKASKRKKVFGKPRDERLIDTSK